MKILVIGHHDRYRAPATAAILNLSAHLSAKSCGFTEIYEGYRVAKKMRDYLLQKEAIDLDYPEELKAKRITPQLVDWADAFVLCDLGCRQRFSEAYPGEEPRMMQLADWAEPPVPKIFDLAFCKKGSEEFNRNAAATVSAAKRIRKHLENHVLRQRKQAG